jgi:hypothetical protein
MPVRHTPTHTLRGACIDSIPIPIALRCVNCGSKALVAEPDLADDSIVRCTDCETEIGRWSNVQKQALESSAEEIKKRLKDIGDGFHPS